MPSIYRLIIDTSSEYSVVGITQDEEILASEVTLHSNQLSQSLMPTLQRLLTQAEVPLHQLHEIAVGVGPGSYTGTRVGVAVAKSLHFALRTPRLRGFCSLVTFLPPCSGSFACVMPSKTGEFYLFQGHSTSEQLICLQSALLPGDQVVNALQHVDTLIGKPLQEVQSHFPTFTSRWHPPEPSLRSILVYLTAQTPDSTNRGELELIYLHNP